MEAFWRNRGAYFCSFDSFSTRTRALMEMGDAFFNHLPHFSTGNEKQSRSLKPTVETVGESEKGR